MDRRKGADKRKIVTNTVAICKPPEKLPLRQYLDQKLVPTLLNGFQAIAKKKPSNPNSFLADYLIKNKPGVEKDPLDAADNTPAGKKKDNSAALKTYLNQKVVPDVLEGILAVGRTRPEDPCQFLADFLVKIQQPPGSSSSK